MNDNKPYLYYKNPGQELTPYQAMEDGFIYRLYGPDNEINLKQSHIYKDFIKDNIDFIVIKRRIGYFIYRKYSDISKYDIKLKG